MDFASVLYTLSTLILSVESSLLWLLDIVQFIKPQSFLELFLNSVHFARKYCDLLCLINFFSMFW